MDERELLELRARAIEELKNRIIRDSYLTVEEVARRWGVHRSTVESLPEEILPYEDLGGLGRGRAGSEKRRQLRRYHPAEVLAAGVRLRRWRRAQQRGEAEAYLARLRAELEARDEEALNIAREMALPAPGVRVA